MALNALFLNPGRSGGPETYLRGLVPALAREFPDVRFLVVTTRSGAAALRADGWSDFVDDPCASCPRGRADALARRRAVPAPAIHSITRRSRSQPGDPRSRVDAGPGRDHVPRRHFLRVRTFSLATTLAFRAIVGPATRRADALLTGSAAARDEICATLGLDPARFLVVPHGAGRPPSGPVTAEERDSASPTGSRARVWCCASARSAPTRTRRCCCGPCRFCQRMSPSSSSAIPEPYDAELRSLATQLGVADRVRFLDYLPDHDLEALWRIADCAAFPTLGEGFGLPVLEAMQRGVPVACSDIPVLREVGGEFRSTSIPATSEAPPLRSRTRSRTALGRRRDELMLQPSPGSAPRGGRSRPTSARWRAPVRSWRVSPRPFAPS